jgi:hypothetical protein
MDSRLPLRTNRRRLIAPLAVALALAAAGPATGAPNPFLHAVDRVNGHLRVAIEVAPEELGEALGGAEIVCALGERAAAQGEAEAAAADWTTLTQLVDEVAVGSEHRVQIAFADADSTLRSLRERYERRWAGEPRRGDLRHAAHTTHLGIVSMRSAIADLDKPFAAWRAHECAAANAGVERVLRRVPTGLRLIELGMVELWRLAGLFPEPGEAARASKM